MPIPQPTISVPIPPGPAPSPTGVAGVFIEHGCQSTAGGFWYFDHKLQGSPPAVYSYLLGRATGEAAIWDPYVHEADADLLSAVRVPAVVRVLAAAKASELQAFKTKADACLAGVGASIAVRRADHLRGWRHHDRYLFVRTADGPEAYMVGSSMEHHRRVLASTSVLRIAEPMACELLWNRFEEFWKNASILP